MDIYISLGINNALRISTRRPDCAFTEYVNVGKLWFDIDGNRSEFDLPKLTCRDCRSLFGCGEAQLNGRLKICKSFIHKEK